MKSPEHYKKVLEARLAELETRLHKIEDHLDEPPPTDFADRATEREGDEVREGLGNAGLEEIRMINAALDRIAHDSFGECVRCGDEIDEARLEIVPHAAICTGCVAKT